MTKSNVSLDEQETVINMFPGQVQNYANIYSCIPATMNRLRKLAASDPDCVRIEKEDDIGIFAQVPSSWISIRKPKKMSLTAEQRAAAGARLALARKKQGGTE